MSYDTIEAAELTVLRLLSNYGTTNSSQRDWRVLAKGKPRIVVLMPGPVLAREVSATTRRIRTLWTTVLLLYKPFAMSGQLATAINNLQTDTQEILDHFDKYPTLNSTSGVIHAMITSVAEPVLWQGESRNYLLRRMEMQIEERVNVTIAE